MPAWVTGDFDYRLTIKRRSDGGKVRRIVHSPGAVETHRAKVARYGDELVRIERRHVGRWETCSVTDIAGGQPEPGAILEAVVEPAAPETATPGPRRSPHRTQNRQPLVARLRQQGRSTRAIGGAIGVSHTEVLRDLKELRTVPEFVEPDRIVGEDGIDRPARRSGPTDRNGIRRLG